MNYLFSIGLLLFSTLSSFGQTNLLIRVEDSLTRQPVIAATVRTTTKPVIGNVTDANGMTRLSNLPAGTKALTVSAVGYETESFPVTTTSDTLIFRLHSQDASLDEVTVTATRTNSRIEDLPIKVEVLGQEDMDEESAVVPGNVSSILGDISIIHIQRTSAVNGNQAIRMQGLDPKYTQILRDGLPLYEGFSGNLGVLQIPPLDLKQVEVVKGSVSTLYGGGAIGGMINIVSKSPTSDKPTFTALINRSGLKESNSNAYYSQRYGKTGLTLFAGYTNQQAVDVTGDGYTDSPEIKQVNFHPKFFYNPTDHTRMNIGYSFTNEHREGGYLPALEGTEPNAYRNSTDLQRHTVDFDASHNTSETNAITLKGALSTFHRKNTDYQKLSDGKQSSLYLEGNNLKRFGKHQLIVGVNLTVEAFRKNPDSTRLVDYTYQTIGGFVQDDWQLGDKVAVQAGLRLDHHNTFGNFLLPRLSVKLKPAEPWTVRLSVGTGYKTPNLFVNQTPGALNVSLIFPRLLPIDVANVKAEKSMGANMDIAYSKTFESGLSVQVDQAFYYTYVNSPVVSAFASTSSNLGAYTQLINAPYNLLSVGTDTYVRLEYKDYELYLGYNHTLSRRDGPSSPGPSSPGPTDNTYLPLAPQDKFSTTLAWESEHVRLGVESAYVGSQYLYNNQKVVNYWFFAAVAEYHYNEHWRLVLNAENLFNIKQANYETVVSGPITQPTFRPVWAPLEGRIVNLALKYTL
ncbi:TonB-dependent receptor [Spirosoma fluviale]|uniref:Iron complex outermembrane recepter protein/outer membrane receptor for ferrienterochelin and colicins n=1 Tax=Spirosoma fluviale TaxID=1597977 RepID=A0A286G1D0_9BACT|nr:TonB-dependent receptor [Spirosoma fluviale]SOD89350.1 iron complex outermembrane recepter protein/outer membrane receptor for ferrienterochelin and colicins [Spirosoma fluviale]